jgi:hypothetical protein
MYFTAVSHTDSGLRTHATLPGIREAAATGAHMTCTTATLRNAELRIICIRKRVTHPSDMCFEALRDDGSKTMNMLPSDVSKSMDHRSIVLY